MIERLRNCLRSILFRASIRWCLILGRRGYVHPVLTDPPVMCTQCTMKAILRHVTWSPKCLSPYEGRKVRPQAVCRLTSVEQLCARVS